MKRRTVVNNPNALSSGVCNHLIPYLTRGRMRIPSQAFSHCIEPLVFAVTVEDVMEFDLRKHAAYQTDLKSFGVRVADVSSRTVHIARRHVRCVGFARLCTVFNRLHFQLAKHHSAASCHEPRRDGWRRSCLPVIACAVRRPASAVA